MKNKIVFGLLLVCFVWASTVSVLYWKLKNNPRVVAVTMDAGKESLQNTQLGEVEKVTFLRQYLERFFNYDSNNFWQSQTSLAFLMSPQLGEARVREVSRLREKIQQKNLSQLGQIKSLRLLKNGQYEAVIYLQIHEELQKGQMQNKELFVTTLMKLHSAERTLENPWGLLVSEMNFTGSSPEGKAFVPEVSVQAQSPSLLIFPCAIENIENPDDKNLKIKITTLNISEIQMTPGNDLKLPLNLVATCKDIEFKFELTPSDSQRDLYVAFPMAAASVRKRDAGSGKPRQKDVYEKTIENVLGIQLDK